MEIIYDFTAKISRLPESERDAFEVNNLYQMQVDRRDKVEQDNAKPAQLNESYIPCNHNSILKVLQIVCKMFKNKEG